MRAAGVLVVIAGVWVGCQVLGGDAFDRLGITGPSRQQLATPITPSVQQGYAAVQRALEQQRAQQGGR